MRHRASGIGERERERRRRSEPALGPAGAWSLEPGACAPVPGALTPGRGACAPASGARERGSALLIAVIAILVITVIGIGTIRFAGREAVGAYATSHQQALVACADAARQQLIAQFHLVGFDPNQLKALDVPLGTSGSGGTTTAQGGHYDTPFANIVFDQVTPLMVKTIGRVKPVEDLTNIHLTPEALAELLKVDIEAWLAEVPLIKEHFRQFGDRLPDALQTEVEKLEKRLMAAKK